MLPVHRNIERDVARRIERWLRMRSGSIRLPLACAVAAGTMAAVLAIAQAWLLAGIVDGVVVRGWDEASILAIVPWLLGAIALRAALAGAVPAAIGAGAARLRRDLRHQLITRMEALGPAWLRGQRSGDLANTLVDSVEELEKYHAHYLPSRLLCAIVPCAMLVAVAPADRISALALCLTAPLIPLFMILVGKGAEAANRRQWHSLARMSAHVFDAIEGLATLRIFNASRRQATIIAAMSEAYRKGAMEVLRIAFLSSLVLEFFTSLAIALVAVFIGLRLFYGEMDFRPAFFALLLAPEFFRPLRDMGAQYHARMSAIGAAERIVALLEIPAPDPIPEGAGQDPAGTRSRKGDAFVAFEGVTFRHAERGEGIEDATFAIRHGECLAIVGPSGAGKSTVASLLLGFLVPDRGAIRIDGRDLCASGAGGWLGRIAWLPQTPTLFRGSILENITLGVPHATLEDVRRAARASAAHDFIARLPHGYHTPIGEGGEGLSGGERRRIAMARAFLKPADVLVLDEPTASLDRPTARRVLRAIRRRACTNAVLLITHDPEAARIADRMLVLEGGRLSPASPGGGECWKAAGHA